MRLHPRFLPAAVVLLGAIAPAQDARPSSGPAFRDDVRRAAAVLESIAVEPDQVYGRAGDRELRLDLYRPKSPSSDRSPCVVLVHGGGWRSGDRRQMRAFGLALAERGFVAASVEYRLAGESPFPACIEDLKCAVRWLRSHADRLGVDGSRFGALGLSAGGHLVSLLGTSGDDLWNGAGGNPGKSARVQAVVSCFGPTDLRGKGTEVGPGRMVRDLFGGPESEKGEAYRLGSPLVHASADDPPFLFLHGDADRLVPLEQSEWLKGALDEARVPASLVRVKNGGHGFLPGLGWVPTKGKEVDPSADEIERQLFAFLDRLLNAAAASRPAAR